MSEELTIKSIDGQLTVVIPADVSEAADLHEGDVIRIVKAMPKAGERERVRARLESFMDTYAPDLERLAQ